MTEKICISCKKKIVNDREGTVFNCPSCSGFEIVRCSYCRVNAVKYHCPACNFIGPN